MYNKFEVDVFEDTLDVDLNRCLELWAIKGKVEGPILRRKKKNRKKK